MKQIKKAELIEQLQSAEDRIRQLESALDPKVPNKGVLQVNNASFQSFIDTIPSVVVCLSTQGKIIEFNSKAEKVFGCTREEVYGKNFHELFLHTETQESIRDTIKNVLAGKLTWGFEHPVKCADGMERIFSWNVRLLYNDQNHTTGIAVMGENITDRQRVAEALSKERNGAQRYFDIANVILLALDKDFNVTLINKKGCEVLGYKKGQILGKNWIDNFLPERLRAEFHDYAKSINTSDGEFIEYRENHVLTKSGREKLIAWHNLLIIDEQGNPIKHISSGNDITERKQTEEALRASEKRFRQLFENSPDAIFVEDLDGIILDVNPAACNLMDTDRKQLIDKSAIDLTPPENRKAVARNLQKQADGRIHKLESYAMGADGRKIPVDITTRRIDYGGRPALLVHLRDITDRRLAEDALHESDEKLREMTELLPEVIFEMDMAGKLTFTNRVAFERFGYTQKEFSAGLDMLDMIIPSDRIRARRNVEDVIRGKQLGSSQYTALRKDGSTFPITIHSVAIIKDGIPVGLRGVIVDITKSKQAEEALKASEERYRTVVETAPDAIVTLDIDGIITSCNTAALVMFDTKQDVFVGRLFSELDGIREQDIPKYHKMFSSAIKGKIHSPIEFKFRCSDGTDRWGEARIGLLKKNRKIEGLQILARDITDRKLADDALRLTQFAVDHAAEAAFWMGPDAHFIYVNNAACQSLGYSRDELLSLTVHDIDPNFPKEVWKDHWKDVQKRGSFTVESHHRRKDGQIFPVEIALNYMKYGGQEYNFAFARNVSERKQSEEALRSERNKAEDYLQIAAVMIVAIGADQNVKLINKKGCDILGYQEHEIIGKNWFDNFIPDDKRKKVKSVFEKLMRCEIDPVEYFENPVVTKNREQRIIAWHNTVLKDPNGHIIGTLSSGEDITERKQAEELQQAVYRISQAVDTTENLDELFKAVHGIIRNVIIADNFYIALHDVSTNELTFPYSMDEVESPIPSRSFGKGMTEYVIRSGSPLLCTQEVGEKLLHQGSAEFVGEPPAVWLGCPLKIGKKTIGIMAVQHYSDPGVIGEREQNILEFVSAQVAKAIERKRAEEALRVSEELNRGIVSHAPIGVMYLDSDGTALYSNPVMDKIMAIPEGEKNPAIGLHADAFPQIMELGVEGIIQRILSGETIRGEEFEYMSETADRRLLEIHAAPRRNPDGDIVGAIVMCKDITGYKELELQLRHAQKLEAVGRLAGGVAHDFNNILTAITGHSDLALMSLDQNDPLQNDISEIQNATKRAADLTGQLLAFSRKQTLKPKIIDLNDVIIEMDKMLRRIIGEDIELSTIPGDNIWNVKVDPGQLEQVIVNLVVNASDAMPKGGKLTIETKNLVLDNEHIQVDPDITAGSYVMIAVSDTGVGMQEEVRARIFEPFFTTKEAGRGTGLGLSTIYGIVKQSNGHITVESEIGTGTTFKIYLPRASGKIEQMVQKQSTTEMPHGNETILVVEDEQTVRTLAVKTLKKLGYTILHAENGGAAFAMCRNREKPVDLIVTDVVMPEMSGSEFVEHVRGFWPDVKVLYMSGYSFDGIVNEGTLDREFPYLRKPFRLPELAQKIREVLDE